MGFQEALEWLQDQGVLVVKSQNSLDKSTTSHDLSTGALNYTTEISDKWKILAVLVHSSIALSATTIAVYFNSETGVNYDTKLGELDFGNTQDLAFIGGDTLKQVWGENGDEITIKSDPSNNSGTLYITVLHEILA
jgi:hypothetical protein